MLWPLSRNAPQRPQRLDTQRQTPPPGSSVADTKCRKLSCRLSCGATALTTTNSSACENSCHSPPVTRQAPGDLLSSPKAGGLAVPTWARHRMLHTTSTCVVLLAMTATGASAKQPICPLLMSGLLPVSKYLPVAKVTANGRLAVALACQCVPASFVGVTVPGSCRFRPGDEPPTSRMVPRPCWPRSRRWCCAGARGPTSRSGRQGARRS
jgi:hypothetical protein